MAQIGLPMSWPQVGKKYRQVFLEAIQNVLRSGVEPIAKTQN
ncbi:hypothetical protein NBRC111894_4345 [Sporolactobacillus inulinus]|nr:hypothetical protein NBRC111894_4345 [Sporolactobacillus inulinus]